MRLRRYADGNVRGELEVSSLLRGVINEKTFDWHGFYFYYDELLFGRSQGID